MMMKALLFAVCLMPAVAFAGEQQFSDGESVTIQPEKAYILVRAAELQGPALSGTLQPAPIFVRVLSDQELKDANANAERNPDGWQSDIETNVYEPLADHPYAEKDGEELLIVAVDPGEYVLGAVAVTNWAMTSKGRMIASLCMGTVKFEAKSGVVTDLGTILVAADDQPTAIPELANVVSGRPRGFGPSPYRIAIRPATPSTTVPGTLKNLPLVSADYRAVAAFPNYLVARISRLAPIPGVLDYDKDGNVIDLKAASATSEQPISPASATPAQSESVATPEIPDTPSPSPQTHLPSPP